MEETMRGYDLQIAYGLNKNRMMYWRNMRALTQVMAAPGNAPGLSEHQTSVKRLRIVSVAGEGLMERINDKVVRHRR